MPKHIQDRVSDWTLAIWVIVVLAALIINTYAAIRLSGFALSMNVTDSILKQIADVGFTVSIHDMVEMHAVGLHPTRMSNSSPTSSTATPDDDYRCACELAHLVGLRLDDG